jgi:hypothetical protein
MMIMNKAIPTIQRFNLFFLILIFGGSTTSFAQQSVKGKIKIYLNSFRCEKETLDDMFEGDGKGDEVFITLFYSVASSNGTTRFINKITTSVYGDNRIWPSRIKAGSAGTNGGIKPNDEVLGRPQTVGLPLLEADLEAGDILTIIPVLWEWDSDTKNVQNSLESYLWGSMNNVNVYLAALLQKFDMKTAFRQFGENGGRIINIQGIKQILQGVNGVPGNRPIGMTTAGDYDPQTFAFNSVVVDNWETLMTPYDRYSNTKCLPVRFDEVSLGNTRDHGQYVVKLYPEFVKAPPDNNGNPKPIKTLNTNDPRNLAAGNISSKVFFTGNWSGTQTTDSGLYPQAVNFQLTANNEFIMADRNGVVAARGTYTLSGISISGSYKLFSSSETFSFSGAYDANTQKLICTLGQGTATTGQGKWTMTKN